MLQLYVVLGLFILECAVVFVLLLPRRPGIRAIQNLVSHALGSNTLRKVLWAVGLILAFLVVDSFREMQYRGHEDQKQHHLNNPDVGATLLVKSNMFRAQRNFYLTFFTFALFAVMFRLRSIYQTMDDLETAMQGKKKD